MRPSPRWSGGGPARPRTASRAGSTRILEADLSVPRKQRHTAKRVYDRAADEMGYEGSYSSIRRYVAAWRGEHAQGPRDGYLELEWAPGTAQVDFGNFRATVAGRTVDLKLLVVTLPHSNARFCAALPCERAEVFCRGLRAVFERIGRAPRLLVLDNATEAGRMAFGKVTESRLFSQFRAHYRCESRYCNPYSGNEKGSVENAVGFLRRNLLVPVPVADSLDELNARLASGCGRINAGARNREGRRTAEALPEDSRACWRCPARRSTRSGGRTRAPTSAGTCEWTATYTAPAPHGTTASRWWACAPAPWRCSLTAAGTWPRSPAASARARR